MPGSAAGPCSRSSLARKTPEEDGEPLVRPELGGHAGAPTMTVRTLTPRPTAHPTDGNDDDGKDYAAPTMMT
jgi:hypothetical protein